jgi:hypothetical protein
VLTPKSEAINLDTAGYWRNTDASRETGIYEDLERLATL